MESGASQVCQGSKLGITTLNSATLGKSLKYLKPQCLTWETGDNSRRQRSYFSWFYKNHGHQGTHLQKHYGDCLSHVLPFLLIMQSSGTLSEGQRKELCW